MIKKSTTSSFFLKFILFPLFLLTVLHLYYTKHSDVTFIGNIRYADGLGKQIIDHRKILQDAGFRVNVNVTNLKFSDLSFKDKVEFAYSYINPLPKLGKVVIYERALPFIEYPKSYMASSIFKTLKLSPFFFTESDIKKSVLISYSMLESTKIPQSWVKNINEHFDLVAVPDPFLVDVYKSSGVIKPIFVLPLGVDYSGYYEKPIKKSQATDTFTFANFSLTHDRKNTVKTIEAFISAFKDNPNVRLIINTRDAEKESYYKVISTLENKPLYPEIVYNVESLDEKSFVDLFSKIDCYISFSKGEGFSIIPRKAMFQGIPTIVTDNTGQSTIARSGLVEVLKSEIKMPAKYFDKYIIGENFDFDIEDAKAALLNVYNNYSKYLENSQKMRDWAIEYDYSKLENKYINIMAKPKKLILGDKNEVTDEYLMTDSKELYEKYLKVLNE